MSEQPVEDVHVIEPYRSVLYSTDQCRFCRTWIYKDSDGVWQHGGGDNPSEGATWPPPLASREVRRVCIKRKHEGAIKAGYCALCGTKVSA